MNKKDIYTKKRTNRRRFGQLERNRVTQEPDAGYAAGNLYIKRNYRCLKKGPRYQPNSSQK